MVKREDTQQDSPFNHSCEDSSASSPQACTRRNFLKTAGVMGAGAAAVGSAAALSGLSGCSPSTGGSSSNPGSSQPTSVSFSPLYNSGIDSKFGTAENSSATEKIYSPDGKGFTFDQDGWHFLHIEGSPQERGYQYGCLLGDLIEDAISRQKRYYAEVSGYDWEYFKKGAQEMWEASIDGEWIKELEAIVEGSRSIGKIFDLWDLVVWNANSELTDYWFPKVASDYYDDQPAGEVQAGTPAAWEHKNHCSAFIATGSYTADGDIIVAHSTWQTYENGRYANLVIDIIPESGGHIIMQSKPGYIHSQADFYETEHLIIAETTIGNFKAYAKTGIPEFIRIRNAAQYAKTLDEFVSIMNEGNTGGYANTWLVGELKTGEIMRYELGLKYYNVDKTKDGFYAGFNAALDPRIRAYETSNATLFADIKEPSGSRFVRIPQLIEEAKGNIDLEVAEIILSDHHDPYLKEDDHPGVRTICSHYDRDPMDYGSRLPYRPQGSVDGKVGSTQTAKKFTIHARFGKSCGMPFSAEKFLSEHPQFEFLRDFLVDFPSLPWTDLSAK